MSIFSKIFKKNKEEIPDLEKVSKTMEPLPKEENFKGEKERIERDNVRAKLDLILTDLDNIKTQNKMMNERIKNIEKTLAEMRGIKYY